LECKQKYGVGGPAVTMMIDMESRAEQSKAVKELILTISASRYGIRGVPDSSE